ncbi:ATP-dependent helicase [Micromonospora chersina]|uniref:ATP-dependent helicase n=1 Tax=Micromonospora chersina TaxID=47854 RepID=UPI0033CE7AE2
MTLLTYPDDKKALLTEPLGNLVLVAPPGCGKTEALALRAKGLLNTGKVSHPRKILALAFSNRARDNIGARIQDLIGAAAFRRSVDLTNFHGLAARIYRAHAATLGLDSQARMPEKGWMKSILAATGASYGERQEAEAALMHAKLRPLTDEEVLAELEASGSPLAVHAEKTRQQEGRLDYGDLLRHAQCILGIRQVAKLYALHYEAILVDEFQDLTLQQFGIVAAIARDNVTFAGDMGQAIYSFGGAKPAAVFSALKALPGVRIHEFNESYRSSPAVLDVLNAIGQGLSLPPVVSAHPDEWIGGGFSGAMECQSTQDEAEQIRSLATAILGHFPGDSVGVLARAGYRRKVLDNSFAKEPTDFRVCVWDNPVHRPEILRLLRRETEKLNRPDLNDLDRLQAVEGAVVAALDPADIESIDEAREACAYLRDVISQGGSLDAELLAISSHASPDKVIGPGLHLLNAHVGKGQQFDWVIILGLEEGHVPMFLAKTQEDLEEEHRAMVVMASRARHGVIITRSLYSDTRYGPRAATPSRWWPIVGGACRHQDSEVLPQLQLHLESRRDAHRNAAS